ncbi:polysaccharide biosynthesis protein [Fictibacillus macauensis ZFHKF-1]|uniref:Polysaccharide biosynthesis protein n=1 Tax=Fictibacillus macauensis ZFHKF-1 TaxID=1196324 RepID=I8UB63_9BACL|nr:polysaccharide biosynthesis protein [Fictibacillus macauensis]EIT84180.1 polysaccharide biosynthesis protein [Fictibacillus macauensis ZFHKF-1]
MNTQSKRVWQGAFFLAVAMFIVKILSVLYRIPYQNITGNEGFYVFQQVYPFYGIAVAFAVSGFPVVLSRLLAEGGADAVKRARVISSAASTFFTVGLVCFIVLFTSARAIARLMGDEQLFLPIQATAYLYLTVPVVAVLRGFFQGEESMMQTAYSQIAEQAVRVACIIGLSYYFVAHGADVYSTGAAATFGSTVGSVVSIVLLGFYLLQRRSVRKTKLVFMRPSLKVGWQLLTAGLLLTASSMIMIIFQLSDVFTFGNLLQREGFSLADVQRAKGVFDRAQPLLQLGTVVATSLSLATVPAITIAKQQGDRSRMREICTKSLQLVFMVGLAAGVGLAVIIKPVNVMLFQTTEGSVDLAIMGIAILFFSLFITSTGLLQGLRYSLWPVLGLLGAVAVKIAGNLLLMPALHATGAAIATVCGAAVAAAINILVLQRKTAFMTYGTFHGMRMAFVAGVMALATFAVKEELYTMVSMQHRLSAVVVSITSAVAGAVVFGVGVVLLRVVKLEEMIKREKLMKITSLYKRLKERRN